MELAKIKTCICEGAAEAAIIDVLLDNELLIFKREVMLEGSRPDDTVWIMNSIYIPHLKWGPRQSRGVA